MAEIIVFLRVGNYPPDSEHMTLSEALARYQPVETRGRITRQFKVWGFCWLTSRNPGPPLGCLHHVN